MKARIIGLSLLVLAGCGREPVPSTSTQGQQANSTSAKVAVSPEEMYVSQDPLPQGVSVEFPYHLRGDRIYATAKGNYRRRVVFENLQGDANEVYDGMVASLASAGFVPKEKKVKEGRVSLGFKKKGVGALHLSVNSKRVLNPAHPDAKGIFSLDYPYQGEIEADGARDTTAIP